MSPDQTAQYKDRPVLTQMRINTILAQLYTESQQRWLQDCERIITAPSLQTEDSLANNPLEDIEKYMHNILEDNDPDTIECRDKYKEALTQYKEVQIFHKTMYLKIIP